MNDVLDLIARANGDYRSLASYLLDKPNEVLSSGRELRFGPTGKFSLTLEGAHAGKWKDWSSNTGGDMIDLIQREKSMTSNEALAWLRTEWFGSTPIQPIDHKARAVAHAKALMKDQEEKAEKIERAGDIWRASEPFEGSLAHHYLVGRLGGREIHPDIIDGGALRWNSKVRMPGSTGAMVALMTDPVTQDPTGVHLTYIRSDGTNLTETSKGRKMSVRRMRGKSGIVRLWPDHQVEMFLAIGEGIETTLAGAIQTGEFPAWSTLNSGNMKVFPVLAGLEGLRIFVDNDANGTGQTAADQCSLRYYEEANIICRQFIPVDHGDFADLLMGDAA